MANVRARLSDDAYEAIEVYCADNGITITSLLEALGQTLHRGELPPNEAHERIVAEARRIMAERKSRRRD